MVVRVAADLLAPNILGLFLTEDRMHAINEQTHTTGEEALSLIKIYSFLDLQNTNILDTVSFKSYVCL
jgi:hypothetical protein